MGRCPLTAPLEPRSPAGEQLPALEALAVMLPEALPPTFTWTHPMEVPIREFQARVQITALRNRAREICADHGSFELVGLGTRRLVVDFGVPCIVAKLGMGHWGRVWNLREWAFWLERREDEIAEVLCPAVCLSPGGVLIARRADPIEPSAATLSALFNQLKPVLPAPSDGRRRTGIQARNVGQVDGRAVVLDYPYGDPEDET